MRGHKNESVNSCYSLIMTWAQCFLARWYEATALIQKTREERKRPEGHLWVAAGC